jgi:hypothetical protein
MRAAFIRILPACLIVAVASFDHGQSTAPTTQTSNDPKVQPATVADGVYTITLPPIAPPEMPDGPQKDLFTGNCILCHTPRYVLMQPAFSRKTWQAEVEKMKKVYGAPIVDDQIPSIVDYLMSVRGR